MTNNVPYQWHVWKAQEPRVDLWFVSDTEVAEYRKWAGTKSFHDNRVKELMEVAGGNDKR